LTNVYYPNYDHGTKEFFYKLVKVANDVIVNYMLTTTNYDWARDVQKVHKILVEVLHLFRVFTEQTYENLQNVAYTRGI
jgi:hypothetical protein